MLEKLLRISLTALLKALFKVEVLGLEHFHAAKDRPVVIIANHQSFLDPMLLAAFMPEKPGFAMNVHQAKKWYFKPLIQLVDVFQVDPMQPMSTKSIIQRLRDNKKVVVFPEGRITVTGGIMKVYEGTGLIIDRTNAIILPLRIEGAQYSKLSRLKGKQRLRWFPRITLTLHPPVEMNLPADLRGRKRRAMSAQRIYDILTDVTFRSSPWQVSLLRGLADATEIHGRKHVVATDITRAELSYGKLWVRLFVLADALEKNIGAQKHVGVLLPTSLAGMVTFLALQALNRIPAMLNFSAGQRNLLAACETVQADTVITSRAFVEKARLEAVVEALAAGRRIVYLEDVRGQIKPGDKISGMLKGFSPRAALPTQDPQQAAVVLFTSGSEGMPKGVVLSHANLMANIYQVAARLSFTQADRMLNALPIFHSFGLTGGTLLPLMLGIRTFLYPNPLHYRIVPEVAYDQNITIMLGTDTFYSGYAKYAHALDFHAVRIAVAGAEKLKPATRQLYAEKYGVNILEGYGVTETSPVLAVNTPMCNKAGTVGRLLPDIRAKLEPVEGLERGARLYVAGVNVMLGYMKHDKPGVMQPAEEWYDTGDIVDIDEQGYVAILGRAKRFAKVGGEMVSLAAVEDVATTLWPEAVHAAMAVPDPRKGELVILLSEYTQASRDEYLRYAQEHGIAEIAIPKRITHMAEIPRLGSGKVDYMKLKEIV